MMKNIYWFAGVSTLLMFVLVIYRAFPKGEAVYLFGSGGDDTANAVCMMDETLCVIGTVDGSIGSVPHFGAKDMCMIGWKQWGGLSYVEQHGTDSDDYGKGVCSDQSGNFFISGVTAGDFSSASNSPFNTKADVFLIKTNGNGEVEWERKYNDSGVDHVSDITYSNGGIYILGWPYHITDKQKSVRLRRPGDGFFLMKIDHQGDLVWKKRWNSEELDEGSALVADDDGFIYIVGFTNGSMVEGKQYGRKDIFYMKISEDGEIVWKVQDGTSGDERLTDILLSRDKHLYMTGHTNASFDGQVHSGGMDVFLRKVDLLGEKKWTKMIGGRGEDFALGLCENSEGSILFTGYTTGAVVGNKSSGGNDVIIGKFDLNGELLWVDQLGSAGQDSGRAILPLNNKTICVVGETNGKWPSAQTVLSGSKDVLVIFYDDR